MADELTHQSQREIRVRCDVDGTWSASSSDPAEGHVGGSAPVVLGTLGEWLGQHRRVADRKRRFERPAFRDGWNLGMLWAAEGALVKLVGGASRGRPEGDHIAQAFRHVRAAIEIVNERSERRRDG